MNKKLIKIMSFSTLAALIVGATGFGIWYSVQTTTPKQEVIPYELLNINGGGDRYSVDGFNIEKDDPQWEELKNKGCHILEIPSYINNGIQFCKNRLTTNPKTSIPSFIDTVIFAEGTQVTYLDNSCFAYSSISCFDFRNCTSNIIVFSNCFSKLQSPCNKLKFLVNEDAPFDLATNLGSDSCVLLRKNAQNQTIWTEDSSIYDSVVGNCAYGNIVFPDNITKIQPNAFEHAQIESFTLTGNVTEIGDDAFGYNSYLKNIKFKSEADAERSPFWIYQSPNNDGEAVFKKDDNGNKTLVDDFKVVGSLVYGNLDLSSYTNVTTISNGAFNDCYALNSIKLPRTLEYIKNNSSSPSWSGAFSKCQNLKYVNIEELTNLKSIADWSFSNTGLSGTLNIPESVESIGSSAFHYNHLEKIILNGDNLALNIPQLAFGYTDYQLTSIVWNNLTTIPTASTEIFRCVNPNGSIESIGGSVTSSQILEVFQQCGIPTSWIAIIE